MRDIGTLNDDLVVCEDQELSGHVDGDIQIESGVWLKLEGNCSGDIQLKSGSGLELHGTVQGDVTVSSGANFQIYGTLEGDLFNSGTAEIIGQVEGDTLTRPGGFTTVDARKVKN